MYERMIISLLYTDSKLNEHGKAFFLAAISPRSGDRFLFQRLYVTLQRLKSILLREFVVEDPNN